VITVAGIKEKAENQYRTYLKQAAVSETSAAADDRQPFFPLVIRCSTGSAADDLTARAAGLAPLYDNSRNKTGSGYTLELAAQNTRRNASQTVIKRIYFENEKEYLSFIGKTAEVKRMRDALAVLQKQLSVYFESNGHDFFSRWAENHLSELTAKHEDSFWEYICLCVNWLYNNPQCNLYIREIPLSVHTKFIENNKALIHSLLSRGTGRSLEEEYGLKSPPVLVRFRMLSKETRMRVGELPVSELCLPLAGFSILPASHQLSGINRIFIIENELVYLTFPHVENALCIWGHGYTVTELASCTWFTGFRLFYFGDLDEHGFDILSKFRGLFPAVKSFCMDGSTLAAFGEFRVTGKVLTGNSVPEHLTEEERTVFMEFRSDPERNRLEQERIPLAYIEQHLQQGKDDGTLP
jgi:hypothetical protein